MILPAHTSENATGVASTNDERHPFCFPMNAYPAKGRSIAECELDDAVVDLYAIFLRCRHIGELTPLWNQVARLSLLAHSLRKELEALRRTSAGACCNSAVLEPASPSFAEWTQKKGAT
jgi:hypothetical protein